MDAEPGLSDADMRWFAARLSIAIYDINAEQQMSINAVREALRHIPGANQMTMRYGDGGRTQIFVIGDDEVEVGPDATPAEIEAELRKKKL